MVTEPTDTPVTTPAVLTVAREASLLLQVPPVPVVVKLIVVPVHTVLGPLIVPALGMGNTVIGLVLRAVPQALVTVYLMVSRPALTPVTIPVVPTVAAAVFTLLHTPPVVLAVRVVVAPTQTVLLPLMVPDVGAAITATYLLATEVPQALVTVYLMLSSPVATPVTMPVVVTVAKLVFMLLQVPPVPVVVRVVMPPTHTLLAPLMVPALGVVLTIILVMAPAVPQLLVTL
jgi:hypothetical protein